MAALEYHNGTSWVTLSPITVTGAVTGTSASTGIISTVLNSTVTMQEVTQNFNFNNITSLANVLNINSGSTPGVMDLASVALKFNNFNNYGFRLTQYTDATGLSNLMLSQENGLGPSVPNELLEFYYSNSDARYRGKFYNPVTIDSGFGGAIASLYILEGPQNVSTDASCIRVASAALSAATIELQSITTLGKLYALRSDNFGYFSITDRTSGFNRMRIASSGSTIIIGQQNINNALGAGSTPGAALEVRGGVYNNLGGEESCIRAIGLVAAKIELQSIDTLGKLWEIRSDSNGTFDIVDRTGGAARLSIDTNGAVNINGSLTVYTTITVGDITATGTILGNTVTSNLVKTRKLIGNLNAPTVVLGAATGTSPSSTITGTELDGTFSVTTGIGATTGLIGTFTIAAMPSGTFSIIFLPANAATASAGLMIWAASTGTTTFTLNTVTTLIASTTYKWNYIIMG